MYADDHNYRKVIQSLLNEDLQNIRKWLIVNKLTRNMTHGDQFRAVSGSMRRLTLSLIDLVKTLEITTKQLKNITLHILKQKQIRKKTKTQVFLL